MNKLNILTLLGNELENYLNSVEGAESIFLSTLDGHIILDKSLSVTYLDSIVPVSGSLLGLAESVSKILNNQQLHENITILENNIFGLFKIHDAEDSLFLGVVCNRFLSIAKMVNFAKSTIKNINNILIDIK